MLGVKHQKESGNHWISVSDLMSVLMMMFLFIAVIYMENVTSEKQDMDILIKEYKETKVKLYESLNAEFKDDLKNKWNAKLDSVTLSIKFDSPKVQFTQGSFEIPNDFQIILDDFFPRYLNTIKKYHKNIAEVRIEGHTSLEGKLNQTSEEAYLYNMELSQSRTRNVLQYCLNTAIPDESRNWIKTVLTANGLSSSQIIKNYGYEDKLRSRRVEFRVRTKIEDVMDNLINKIGR
jgi:outer membrane protein OmpA-like peptidoglycan-associated protein